MDLKGTSKVAANHQNDNSTVTQINAGPSPVSQMFDGRSVFITGASGFIGRVLLEKLLRSYPGITNVYILMRSKKNQNPYDRLHKQLLQVPIFNQIRCMPNGQELLGKIVVIAGDIALPRLGISDEDMGRMVADKSLSIVFHSAATIKFDEPIRQSVALNLVATREIISLCRRLPNLIGLCHVSTAFVNSDILDGSQIEEKLYPMRDRPQNLIKLSELMDENLMQGLKVQLVGQRPNTYTYTKALAEHLIAEEASDLPVTIVRPSIVTGAWREPLPGWVDNLNGPTGLLLAVGKGLLRSMLAVRSVVADIIPVDLVVNTMIASTFYTAKAHNTLALANGSSNFDSNTKKMTTAAGQVTYTQTPTTNLDSQTESGEPNSVNGTKALDNEPTDSTQQEDCANNKETNPGHAPLAPKRPPHIVHCTSGDVKPLLWGDLEDMFSIVRKYPSAQVLRYPFGSFKSNRYLDLVARIFAHYLPALVIDMICGLLGKKRQLLRVYDKLHSATGALAHFCCNSYYFKVGNIRQLEEALSEEDKRDLYMDVRGLDWTQYFEVYVLGARRYVLKEPDDNLADARRSFQKAYYIEISLRVILAAFISALSLPFIMRLATTYQASTEAANLEV